MPSTTPAPTVEEGQPVHGIHDEHVGTTTGGTRRCSLHGCTGRRVATRWEDGRLTYPCEKGMSFDPETEEWSINPHYRGQTQG
jgi:hypothetical protein